MADRMEVQIGAEIKELQSKLNDAQNRLKQFSSKADKNLGNFSSSTNKATKGVSNLGKGTANAVPALNEFSRVIQDAPFGIQGVANNITQLTTNFGYLSKSAGGTGNALKLMLSTLTGPAGILLAVSAVTSLLVSYGDEIQALIDPTSKLSKENQELTESIKGFIGTAEKEIATLNVLLGVARNETNSRKKREEAVKKINEIYPDYLGNLKLEGVNSETTTEQVNKLTKALVQQATVKGLLGRISELATKRFEAEQKTAEEYISTTNKIGSAFSFLFSTSETYTTSFGKGSKKRQDAISEEDKKIQGLQNSIQKILESSNVGIDFFLGGGKDKPEKEVRNRVTSIFDILKNNVVTKTQEFNQSTLENPPIIVHPEVLDRQKVLMQSFTNEWSMLMENLSSVNLVSGFAESLGQAISQGGNVLSSLGDAVLRGMGGFLTDMGKMLIKYGSLAIAKGKIDTAIAAGGPVAIGAGVAAIAVGAALVAAGSALSSRAQSGFGGANNGTNAGSNNFRGGSSFSAGSSGGFGSNNVVFEIAGTKLVGVLRNTFQKNKNLGGNLAFD